MSSDLRKLILSRLLFTLATQVQSVALGWQMYLLTKSPLYIGVIGLAEAVPALGLALYAGYVADRARPIALYGVVGVLSLCSSILMWWVVLPNSSLEQHTQVIALLVSSALTGVARAFSQPSIYSIV